MLETIITGIIGFIVIGGILGAYLAYDIDKTLDESPEIQNMKDLFSEFKPYYNDVD